jgi:hypothetical protein
MKSGASFGGGRWSRGVADADAANAKNKAEERNMIMEGNGYAGREK